MFNALLFITELSSSWSRLYLILWVFGISMRVWNLWTIPLANFLITERHSKLSIKNIRIFHFSELDLTEVNTDNRLLIVTDSFSQDHCLQCVCTCNLLWNIKRLIEYCSDYNSFSLRMTVVFFFNIYYLRILFEVTTVTRCILRRKNL